MLRQEQFKVTIIVYSHTLNAFLITNSLKFRLDTHTMKFICPALIGDTPIKNNKFKLNTI